MTSERLDLRLAPLALTAWGATALAQGWGPGRVVVLALLLLAAGGVLVLVDGRHRRPSVRGRLWVAAVLVVAGGSVAAAGLRGAAVGTGPVGVLAEDRASVEVVATVAGDPVPRAGPFGPYVVVRVVVEQVTGRGQQAAVRSPVLVIGDQAWSEVRYGDRVQASGRLQAALGPDLSGVLIARGPPRRLAGPGVVHRGVAAVRAGITEAAAPLPPTERVLVPALVNGDDTGMPEEAVDDFRTTGLTHLLAVSGANVTLVVGFVLLMARWCRVRGRWLMVVGVLAVVFFVLVARPQPSVLRAAAMGLVAIVGLSADGRSRGVRALCLSVLVLVLADPWLARSVGFLLSVLATSGILLLAPAWRDALGRWMPRPCAEAVAVPLAAQVVCTPVVAALSGQVSIVAVLANVLAAPAVGPTTVLGFGGGLVAVVSATAGHVVGRVAGGFAWWIVAVAEHGAGLDGAAVGWPVGPVAVLALAMLCAAQVALLSWLLRHRWPCLAVGVMVAAYIVHPPGRPGWPPPEWRVVMCDVGQGDGLVLNAAPGVAVVVDAGPDPSVMDRCLERLGVEVVALVVLTHFHADHVDGLAGVLDDRSVGEIEVSPLAQPAAGADLVTEVAAAGGVPVTTGVPGAVRTVGAVTLRTIGPPAGGVSAATSADEGSAPNNASLVMLARIGGLDVLLAGDSEAEEQEAIVELGIDLAVDVLKVAHHGSANQDADFVLATDARVALVSVGADNTYGHPAGHLLGLLARLGAQVYRTDERGDVAVVEGPGGPAVVPYR